MQSMSTRNPTGWPGGDYGPPTEIQPRLTGLSQTGRLVIIDNPISYVVEPGRYYPFLSLRGHDDPTTKAIVEQMQLGDVVGRPMPAANATPPRVAAGHERTLWRGQAPLVDTTLHGIGPEGETGVPHGQPLPTEQWWTGVPFDTGLVGI